MSQAEQDVEDKFENFYIRYSIEHPEDIGVALWINASVWDEPAVGANPRDGKPLFDLQVKWDGCSHMRMPYLHFDGLEEFDAFVRVVKYIYNDLCDKHNVGD